MGFMNLKVLHWMTMGSHHFLHWIVQMFCVDAREYNNFIFSHAPFVHCKTATLKKKLMCRPYPFFYLIANIVRARRLHGIVLHCWLKHKINQKERERQSARKGAHNAKMSQEIKTPSIVNLQNELGAHDSLSIHFGRFVYQPAKTHI